MQKNKSPYEQYGFCEKCNDYHPAWRNRCPVHPSIRLRTKPRFKRNMRDYDRIDVPDTPELLAELEEYL